jgi:hypothetical protein
MQVRRLHAFAIFPKRILVAYFIGLCLLLLTSSLIVVIGVSQASSVSYSVSGQTAPGVSSLGAAEVITEKNARTIYNSRVPVTIADAINTIDPGGQAYAETVTLVQAQGIPIVVVGLSGSRISTLGMKIPSGSNSSTIAFVGKEAEARLNVGIGDRISIVSTFQSNSTTLTVAGFFSTGSELDYEIITSLSTGQGIAGLPQGISNAIVIPVQSLVDLKSIASQCNLTISYRGISGTLLLIDSSGYIHSEFQIPSNNESLFHIFNAILPFGLYNAELEQNGIRTSLQQFVATKSPLILSLNSTFKSGNAFLKVAVGNASISPELVNSSNQTVEAQSINTVNKTWTYYVNLGAYTLISNGISHKLLVFGNTTFDSNSYTPNAMLEVGVVNINPAATSTDYSITVVDAQSSRIVFSSFSSSSSLSIPLVAGHSYNIDILTSENLYFEKNISIDQSNDSVLFDIPYVQSEFQNVPISDYGSLGFGFPSGSASFNYFLGTTIASTMALVSLMVALLVITIFVLDSQLVSSLRKEIVAILYMFPDRRKFFLRIRAPMLLLNIAGGLTGMAISFLAFILLELDSHVTFAGFGISAYPLMYVAPVVTLLSLLSWSKLSHSMGALVYGEADI